jgi:hypothetical protein
LERWKVNVVGEGVILTVKGNVSSEGGFVSVVEAVVDLMERLFQELPLLLMATLN